MADNESTHPLARNITKKELNQITILASIGMSDSSVAEFMDIPESTIKMKAAVQLQKGRGRLKKKLLEAQFTAAIKYRSAAMLIWLGKQFLGQHDHPQLPKLPQGEGGIVTYTAEWGSKANDGDVSTTPKD